MNNTIRQQRKPENKSVPHIHNQNGFALIAVLAVLFLVTLVALSAFSTSDTDRRIASNNLRSSQAFYAAEAGINRACGMLYDSLWRTGFADASVGNAAYSVQVFDSLIQPGLRDSLILRSTGRADGSESVIEVRMAKKRGVVFRQAVYGDSSVRIGGNALIDAYNSDSGSYSPCGMGGDVGSNGLIHVAGDAVIYGDVRTADTTTVNGNMTIYGTTDNSAPAVTLEPITQADLDNAKWNNNVSSGMTLYGGATYSSGTYALSASGSTSQITLTSGIYFFSSISLTSGAQLIIPPDQKVVIFMTSSLNASGGSIVNTTTKPANLQIYSTGPNVDITGSSTIYAAIYAPNAAIKVSGSGMVYGSLVGKSIQDAGNGTVHYDRALEKLESPLKPKYKAVNWRVL